MKLQGKFKKQTGHPGPYCIECKKPFGSEHEIGYLSETGEPVYHQEVVGTNEKTFCVCLNCMREKQKILLKNFLSTLTKDQKRLFKELNTLNSNIFSYVVLMS